MTTAPDPETMSAAAGPREAAHPVRVYRYYDLVMAAFVTVLLCANVIGAAKRAQLFGFTFGAGVLFFPVSYVFGDILTEVYGYARARKVVWAGFGALGFASFMSWAILQFPPAPGWSHQAAYETVFGGTWRIALASLVAYFCGEFCNSFVLAKMKIWSSGRKLWMRTIGSTIAGELVDSLVFYPLAFLGIWTTEQVLEVLLTNYALKVGWEAVMTPFTYRIVNFLKRAEHEDYFDRNTDFTPFSLRT
jgi:queuosine precursor transporter